MIVFSSLRTFLDFVFRRSQVETEMEQEFRSHLRIRAQDLERQGLSRAEAERQARIEFGGYQRYKEECREALGTRLLGEIVADVRYGLRQLRRNPGFTTVGILTLALGIGTNTAIFSVVYGVLLRPLPYPNPGRLVSLYETEGPGTYEPVPYLDFRDWQRENHSFTQLAAVMGDDLILTEPEGVAYVQVNDISADFFSTLGADLALGRQFLPEEDKQGGRPVAIISHRFWEQHFGGSSRALGRALALSGKDYTVVGILPPGFRLYGEAEVYIPLGQGDASWTQDRKIRNGIDIIGRLKPGVTLEQARADMGLVQGAIAKAYPDSDKGVGAALRPLRQEFVGNFSRTLMLLMVAVGLVLLIACANVANLMLARSATRGREFAIRFALGARRVRLIRQLLAESTMLGLIGGGLGLAIAQWGTHPVLALVPGGVPLGQGIRVEPHVLAFALAISVLTGILFGLAPALMSTRANLQERLKEGTRATQAGPHRTQALLVVAETALTAVLLVAAGLMMRTMWRLWHVNPGFNPHHAVAFNVAIAPQDAPSPEKIRLAFRRLLDQASSVPGVQAAGLTNMVPLGDVTSSIGFWIGPQSTPPQQSSLIHQSLLFITTPGYFRAMEIPLLRGRFFNGDDTPKSPHVVVVDDALARQFFPGSDPIGKGVNVMFLGPAEIVGIAGTVKHFGLGSNPKPEIYFPLDQLPGQLTSMTLGGMDLIVRTPLSPASIIPSVRRTLMGPGEYQALFGAQTMEEVISKSTAGAQFPMVLLGLFACSALLLASVRIYGVVSYLVSRRTHEIGIRMALGAQKSDVLKMVIRQGLSLTLIGVGIGVAGALGLTRFLSSLLYGVTPTDPLTFIVVSLILTAVALLAGYIPARRAAKVDPMVALRYE
jgi:putative ABC transport system permease protein